MRAKALQHNNAPGETRTPNLLIRSQPIGWLLRGPAGQSAQEADERVPKTDSISHNNSHNASPLLSSSSPKNNGPVIKQENEEQFCEGEQLKGQQQSPQTRIQPNRGVAR